MADDLRAAAERILRRVQQQTRNGVLVVNALAISDQLNLLSDAALLAKAILQETPDA